MRIAIVTDSAADLPKSEIEKYNISIVPTILIINGKEEIDGESISREEYYNQIPTLNPAPTTAAPSSGEYSKVYQSLFNQGYDKIFSIHISSALSGIFNSARIAAENFAGKVTLFDSKNLSMGLGFQALKAAEIADAGGVMEEIVSSIQKLREKVELIALLDTLDQLRKGGRANWMQANLGKLLKLKLMIGVIDGKIEKVSQTRTRKRGLALLEEKLTNLGPLQSLSILHTNAWKEAELMAEKFASQCESPITVENVTPVVGTQVGVNAIGYASVKI
jgi:DegV family protein with EDD domain